MKNDRLLFHTIAIEPSRWTPKRVSMPLTELLPKIAEAGFSRLEIFEPHLRETASRPAIKAQLAALDLEPVILSSYLNPGPGGVGETDLEKEIGDLAATIRFFGFQKVRIFPGPGISPEDAALVDVFTKRLALLGARLEDVEILLETHDGSIADDPEKVVDVLKAVDLPNIGLLFQPTVFEHDRAMRQVDVQAPFIRHVHLQNRHADLSFSRLEEGVIQWSGILERLPESVGLTLEFVPLGICSESEFDLDATLSEAAEEMAFIERISGTSGTSLASQNS